MLFDLRLKTLSDFPVMTDSFFRDYFVLEEDGLAHLAKPESREFLASVAERLARLDPFTHEAIETVFRDFVEERKIKAGQVIHPARMAVSGKTKGAGLFEMMEVLGRERTVERLRRAAHG